MKIYEVNLPIFKRGDDLHWARENTSSDVEAFRLYAQHLKESADIMDKFATLAADGVLTLEDANCHMIVVSTTEEVAEKFKDNLDREMFEDLEEEEEVEDVV